MSGYGWVENGLERLQQHLTTWLLARYDEAVWQANNRGQQIARLTHGAALLLAFAHPAMPRGIITLSTLLITLILCLEAQRYRQYMRAARRIRLIEVGLMSPLLLQPVELSAEWFEQLVAKLQEVRLPATFSQSLGVRLRSVYLWIYLVADAAHLIRSIFVPTRIESWPQFLSRLTIGPIAGWATLMLWTTLHLGVVLIGLLTAEPDQV